MAHSIELTSIDDQIPLLPQTKKDEIEEERNMDYLIEIKETNGEDRSRVQTNKSTKQLFDERFKDLNSKSTKSCTIFRVTAGLSQSNPEAYKPMLISIGPYHNKNPKFCSMEKYKLMYLQRFLQRKEGFDVESCIREMEELKDEALKCYDNLEDLDRENTDQFSQMLLFDGCFVVEYILERCGIIPTGEDTIIKGGCIDNQVRRDLLLLENQLPFFVLTKLHDMIKLEVDEMPFTIMVKYTFFPSLPKITPASFFETEGNARNIKHLLHLVHMSCYPSQMKTSISSNSSMREVEHRRQSLCWNLLQKIKSTEVLIDRDQLTWHGSMPNATELSEAGVSFKKVGTIYHDLDKDNLGDTTSLFDIEFENGLMKIPCFEITDNTETLLRNFIAYEQQSPEVRPRYFCDYAIFMDYLIDSEKDVSLLRLKGIIRNRIGEDKEVASFFNKIGKGVAVSLEDFYYKEQCKKAIQHCEKPWNRKKANLRRNYFHSPWAGISTVAAIILLLLTATQTVLSFISLLK